VRDLAIASLFATAVALVPVAIALAPKAASPVVIFAAPWGGEAARIAAAAGGSILSATGHIAVARFSTEGFVSQLYRAGALLVLDATLVTACFPVDRGRLAAAGASL
jgi:hypothetical protein